MNAKDFDMIVTSRQKKSKDVLSSKAKEYASDADRLHNFKIAANILQCTPEQALLGMAVKHLTSIIDMVNGETKPTTALIDEKIGDMINYLHLLEALFNEKIIIGDVPCECQGWGWNINGEYIKY